MDCFSTENEKVQEVLRKYFTQKEWNLLPEIIQSRYLNTTRHYLEGDNGKFFICDIRFQDLVMEVFTLFNCPTNVDKKTVEK